MKFKLKYIAILLFIIFIFLWFYNPFDSNEGLHIALIGPMTGKTAINGKAYLEGVNMAVNQINQNGGINEKNIIVDVYDDQNDKVLAEQKAKEIVDHNRALIVIGHNYSSCSNAGGNIYQKNRIPAVTPTSTHPSVTIDNPWYFRITFNDDLQGRFLANYAKKVLKCEAACIISEELAYGANLADTFKKTLKQMKVRILSHQKFNTKAKNLDQKLDQIVNELNKTLSRKSAPKNTIIYLSVHSPEGVRLIQRIKDRGIKKPIMTPDALASQSFVDGFSELKKEKTSPGYYTDGIYVATPFIYDTAKENAQRFKENYQILYGTEPDWRAAFAYDAAMLAAKVFKDAKISGSMGTLIKDRKTIRDKLEQMNQIQYAMEGITGFNYFNKDGDTPKPISIGVYKNNKLISALTQLQSVYNENEIADVKDALTKERVVIVDGQLMYKTNVVYTGIEVNEIKSINFKERNCKVDFYLWFRYQGNIDIKNIVFTNAIGPIKLGEPTFEDKKGQIEYKAFHIVGNFKMNYLPYAYTPEEHLIGIKFHHQALNENNLIFVTDIIGMHLNENTPLINRIQKPEVLSTVFDCQVKKVVFHRNVIQKNSLGNLQYLNDKTGMIDYSCFNLEIWVLKNKITLRGVITNSYWNIFILSISIIMLFLIYIFHNYLSRHFLRLSWMIHSIFLSFFLLSSESLFLHFLAYKKNPRYMEMIKLMFDVLWWIIPAYLINLAIKRFIWVPLELKSNRSVPKILQNFLAFLFYLLAFFGIIAYVFDQKLTSLLATSGMVAMIIGLAIQVNIANIFSGIAINLEHPFRINDWIKIGDDFRGKVVDITWRTIKLRTMDGSLLSLPNSIASESPIHNYNHPNRFFWNRVEIFVDHKHNPDHIKKILKNALLSVNGIVKSKDPSIRFGLNEWAAVYTLFYCLDDYDMKFFYKSKVFEQAWIHLFRSGIRPAVSRQELYLFEGLEDRSAEEAKLPISLISEIDLFQHLSEKVKIRLSKRMQFHHFQANDIVFKQGDIGDSLFVIREGVVGVWIKMENGEAIEVARLGAGSFFGEMALLTGEPRTASIITKTEAFVYEITKNDFAPIIESFPETAQKLSQELTKRSLNREFLEDEYRTSQMNKDELNNQFLNRIIKFFGVKKQPAYAEPDSEDDIDIDINGDGD
ncbi:membrane protein containing Mechanosensitive ion channel MscS [Candidatus Magnetomorum sp. HK-1]|nr:membrane protein containing Mechanosensitive ion channel MscS [Candidatus Magnetomorum sp. HK-1]